MCDRGAVAPAPGIHGRGRPCYILGGHVPAGGMGLTVVPDRDGEVLSASPRPPVSACGPWWSFAALRGRSCRSIRPSAVSPLRTVSNRNPKSAFRIRPSPMRFPSRPSARDKSGCGQARVPPRRTRSHRGADDFRVHLDTFTTPATMPSCDGWRRMPPTRCSRGCGGIGRRAGFRCLWGQPRGGSSPLIRSAYHASADRPIRNPGRPICVWGPNQSAGRVDGPGSLKTANAPARTPAGASQPSFGDSTISVCP